MVDYTIQLVKNYEWLSLKKSQSFQLYRNPTTMEQ